MAAWPSFRIYTDSFTHLVPLSDSLSNTVASDQSITWFFWTAGLCNDYEMTVDSMKRLLPEDLVVSVLEHTNKMQENEFVKTKERQRTKMERLLDKKKQQDEES